jgi:hypothetical protein
MAQWNRLQGKAQHTGPNRQIANVSCASLATNFAARQSRLLRHRQGFAQRPVPDAVVSKSTGSNADRLQSRRIRNNKARTSPDNAPHDT